MKFISLFAGVGGFDLALERLGHECVYANDKDRYCKIIYDKNFCKSPDGNQNRGSQSNQASDDGTGQGLEPTKGQTFNISQGLDGKYSNGQSEQRTPYYDYRANGLDTRSITTVSSSEIPDHDLLVGGFPCQAFSIAGKRRGFNDTRGTLFFDVARILKDKKPRYFILENVKGLLSHDNGNTFKTIIATLDELGYDLQWQVLNSKNFGVPQNRERVFIVGHTRGTSRPEIFPIGENNPKNIEYVHFNRSQQYRTISENGISPTIPSQRNDKLNLEFIDMTMKDAKVTDVARTIQARYYKGWSNHSAANSGVLDGIKIRRLTPLECERLQGFPDGWTEGVSDTQRYKQMGNAVTVNVVEAVARHL